MIQVALVEDNREIREGLRVLIESAEGFRCCGAFRSMEDALDRLARDVPHLVLVDIGLPGLSGIDGIRILRERFPGLILLVLSVFEDDGRIFEAICAGASGYLLKKTPQAKLIESLRDAASGGAPMSPEVAQRVLELFRAIHPPRTADYNLTPHDLRLLKLLADGHSYRTAALDLGVSANTIAFHMKRIYEKLEVHSKSEAVSKVLRARLIR